jgi:ectoine hydroxylase-related dioxygenase (phytanoyl-CoA dioxygenase family)
MTRPPLPSGQLDIEVTDEQVTFFRENGYLAVDRVTTDEEVAWLADVFDELFAENELGVLTGYFDLSRPYDADGPDHLPQVLFPEQRVPEIKDTIFRRNTRIIASRLLDTPADDLHAWGHMIHKPAHHGHETPWHQDEAYWPPEFTYQAVGAWMPLDDTDEDNGCLWFIPGAHRQDVLPHRHIGDDPAVHGLFTDQVDPSPAVAVPLRAGGVTFHHPRMLHHSGPNRTDRQRRALATEYQTDPVRRDEPAERPWVAAGNEAMARAVAARTSQPANH